MSERAKRWGVGTIATVLSLVAGAASGFWVAGQYDAQKEGRIKATERIGDDHELRLRSLEKEVGGMAADVRWIRQVIEKVVK
jgi:hypothetical protein